jgi:hypothetical protein
LLANQTLQVNKNSYDLQNLKKEILRLDKEKCLLISQNNIFNEIGNKLLKNRVCFDLFFALNND